MGGQIFRLNRVAKKIWELLEHTGAFMQAVYIATDKNPADALTHGITSHKQMLDTEVQLNPRIFASLCSQGPFIPIVDWFASEANHQLPRFFVWHPTQPSLAEGVNAFMVSWRQTPGYVFPPFSLLPRIIRKVKDDNAQVLLLHPNWPGAPWYPSLQKITVMQLSIPASADVLRYPDHPDLRHPMTDLQLQASWLDGASDSPTWKTIEAALAPSTQRAYSAMFQTFLHFISQVGRTMDNVKVVDVLSRAVTIARFFRWR
jgi:hypothetical protein